MSKTERINELAAAVGRLADRVAKLERSIEELTAKTDRIGEDRSEAKTFTAILDEYLNGPKEDA